ncbi:MAG: hypothetical protein PVI54_03900 [Desulfobacteraceae bacterium]|jgi:hypothetical protein
MDQKFSIPEEYEIPFRRILPYLSAPMQNDPKVLESLLLYFKLGGEKMARIVIDALNVTERIQYAAMIKKMREEAMLRDHQNESDEDQKEQEDGDSENGDETDTPD